MIAVVNTVLVPRPDHPCDPAGHLGIVAGFLFLHRLHALFLAAISAAHIGPELLDPGKRLHPYLFEHHAERDLSSFLQTALGHWRPFRFWSHLHPGQPSNRRRLIRYWRLTVLAYLLPVAVQIGAFISWAIQTTVTNRAWAEVYYDTPTGRESLQFILPQY